MPIARRIAAGFAVAVTLLLGSPALCAEAAAPDAHNLELSKRLFGDMHMSQMMDGMMKQIGPAMMEQARQANPSLTAEQAKAIDEAISESTTGLLDKMQERMIPLYASTFTEKELQDFVNFYEGPSGQAMLNKMPVLMSKMTPMILELMPQMQADVMKRLCATTACPQMKTPPKPGA